MTRGRGGRGGGAAPRGRGGPYGFGAPPMYGGRGGFGGPPPHLPRGGYVFLHRVSTNHVTNSLPDIEAATVGAVAATTRTEHSVLGASTLCVSARLLLISRALVSELAIFGHHLHVIDAETGCYMWRKMQDCIETLEKKEYT